MEDYRWCGYCGHCNHGHKGFIGESKSLCKRDLDIQPDAKAKWGCVCDKDGKQVYGYLLKDGTSVCTGKSDTMLLLKRCEVCPKLSPWHKGFNEAMLLVAELMSNAPKIEGGYGYIIDMAIEAWNRRANNE